MDTQKPWPFRHLGTFFLILMVANLFFLDVVLVKQKETLDAAKTINSTNQSILTKSYNITNDTCKKDCVNAIYDAIHKATASVEMVTQKTQTRGLQDYYVPFGSGTLASGDWVNVPGLQAYIDTANYGTIKKVTFEASLYIPTGIGKGYARLFNITDQHPVWNSEVSLESSTAQLLISSPITLDSGEKLYQVQIKTTINPGTNLTQSRVHIRTN